MKKSILLLMLFLSISGFSQDLDNLDRKYGFNKFLLESNFELYKSDLEYNTSDQNGVKYYKYIKKDINVFGYSNLIEIGVGFYKNRLYTINIDINPSFNDDVYYSILLNLKKLFGDPVISSLEGNGNSDYQRNIENIHQWSTTKTLLGYSKIKCSSPLNPCSLNLFLVSQVIQRQITNDGF